LTVTVSAADEPLAVFQEREITGRDWDRTLVSYRLLGPDTVSSSSPADRQTDAVLRLRKPVAPGNVHLVDGAGEVVPFQLWRVQTNEDGTISSARLSFHAELEAGGSYRYELLGGPGAQSETGGNVGISTSGGVLTLANDQVAIRLREPGRHRFDQPLSMGDVRRHGEISDAYGELAQRGIAFGPIRGIGLADGAWVGGSYFATEPIEAVRAEQNYFDGPVTERHRQGALAAAPKVSGYTCEVTERGPLFAEARVRFRFDNGGYHRLTARVLAGDPAVRIDEAMDLKGTSPQADPLYVMMSVGDPDWRPDALFAYGPRGKSYDELHEALKEQGIKPTRGSMPITYEKDHKVVDLVPHDPWSRRAHYLGLVKTEELVRDR
jgi:hypothetical protein